MSVVREWLVVDWRRVLAVLAGSVVLLSAAASFGFRPLIDVVSALATGAESVPAPTPPWMCAAGIIMCSLVMAATWQCCKSALAAWQLPAPFRHGWLVLLALSALLFLQALTFAALSLIMCLLIP